MRNLKYLGLVFVLLLAVVVPVSAVSAGSDTQVRILSRVAAEHGHDALGWRNSPDSERFDKLKGKLAEALARLRSAIRSSRQFTPLTGKLIPPETGAKRYAIVVGSNYESLPPDTVIAPFVPPFGANLNWAANDAMAMAGLLVASGFDEVVPLIGSGPTGASKDNILRAIKRASRLADDEDEVVFYFSGHGAQLLKSERGRGWGVASEGIVTDEGDSVDYIWDKDLDKAFKGLDAERVVFMFDACLTGGMTELAGQDRLVLMATTKDGIAVEDSGPDDPGRLGIDQGFFTFFVMAALTGNAPLADALVSAVLGVEIDNPYSPDPGAAVSIEQAYNYASWSLIAVSPLVAGGLELYFGPEIAKYWDTPTVVDSFRGDMLL